jgi:hypothetical protein
LRIFIYFIFFLFLFFYFFFSIFFLIVYFVDSEKQKELLRREKEKYDKLLAELESLKSIRKGDHNNNNNNNNGGSHSAKSDVEIVVGDTPTTHAPTKKQQHVGNEHQLARGDIGEEGDEVDSPIVVGKEEASKNKGDNAVQHQGNGKKKPETKGT